VQVANEPRFADLPPARIVPTLADEGLYIASESSFSRAAGPRPNPPLRTCQGTSSCAPAEYPCGHRSGASLDMEHDVFADFGARSLELRPLSHWA
jgi:hypothetical protein